MPGGRKPQLTVVTDNEKARHTKAELDARREGEVSGAESKLTPPRTLSKLAKKEWRRVVKLYRQLDAEVINDLDINLLAAYCENVAIFQEAEAQYQQRPLAEWDEDGAKWVESPYIRIMDGAAKNDDPKKGLFFDRLAMRRVHPSAAKASKGRVTEARDDDVFK